MRISSNLFSTCPLVARSFAHRGAVLLLCMSMALATRSEASPVPRRQAPLARAVTAPHPTRFSPRHVRARGLVERARAELRSRRFDAAIRYFREAFRLWPRNVLWFNLCVAYLAKGDRYQAARALHRYLRRASPSARAAVPPEIRAVLRDFGVLTIRAPRKSFSIWLDGRRVATGNASEVLHPGHHVVEVRRGSRVLSRDAFTIAAGQTILIHPTPLPTPRHAPARPRASSSQSRARLHWAFFATSVGLALGLAAAFTYTGIRAKQMERAWADDPLPIYKEQGRDYMLATNVLIGLSAACGLTAVLLAIFTRWRRDERSATLMPRITGDSLSLSLSGRF